MIITALVTIIAAYLIGSINFAVIFSKVFLKKDVRNLGSGNAGTTNVMRNGGFLPGILTFVCDALKGFVASYMGKLIFDYIFEETAAGWSKGIYGAFICGTFCMLGHVFPIFFQFKGGKGVATSVGIFAVCSPIAIILGLAVFAITLFIFKMVSLSSLIATFTVVFSVCFFHSDDAAFLPQILFAVIMGIIVVSKHKTNIKRLLEGSESKIGKGKK